MQNREIQSLNTNSGATLILFIFILPSILAIIGLVIDIGYQIIIKEDLQNAATSGAHAGAIVIKQGEETIKIQSMKMIKQNIGSLIKLDRKDINIQIGYYDPKYSRFINDKKKINAVKVLIRKTHGLFFSSWISGKLLKSSMHVIAYQNSSNNRILLTQIN